MQPLDEATQISCVASFPYRRNLLMDFEEMKKKYEPSKEQKIVYRKYGRKFILTSSPFVAFFFS